MNDVYVENELNFVSGNKQKKKKKTFSIRTHLNTENAQTFVFVQVNNCIRRKTTF